KFMYYGRQKNKVTRSAARLILRQFHYPWQRPRGLNNRHAPFSAKSVFPFEGHNKIETFVEDTREGMYGIKTYRAQYRHHMINVGAQPFSLPGSPVRPG